MQLKIGSDEQHNTYFVWSPDLGFSLLACLSSSWTGRDLWGIVPLTSAPRASRFSPVGSLSAPFPCVSEHTSTTPNIIFWWHRSSGLMLNIQVFVLNDHIAVRISNMMCSATPQKHTSRPHILRLTMPHCLESHHLDWWLTNTFDSLSYIKVLSHVCTCLRRVHPVPWDNIPLIWASTMASMLSFIPHRFHCE